MASNTRKSIYKNYNVRSLKKAIVACETKKMGIRAASKAYSIPFSTLWSKVNKLSSIDTRPGPPAVLSKEEEGQFVNWILDMNRMGFCINKQILLNSVQKFIKDSEKETPFIDSRPSKKWYNLYLDRHPEVAKIMAQNLSLRKNVVTEAVLRNWFQKTADHIAKADLSDIDGSRIFNSDELSFQLNPHLQSYNKECLTTLITGNAAGQLAPPMILYPYMRIPAKIIESVPNDWALGRSQNGCMNQKHFYEYISGPFYRWCKENCIQFPIILFVNGHSSHLSLDLSVFCKKNNILLLGLCPNASHLIQPMTVSLFQPLKTVWNEIASNWRQENDGISVNNECFAGILQKSLERVDVNKILINGFEASGLHPFDANKINYSNLQKCDAVEINSFEVSEKFELKCLSFIEKEIDERTLQLFKEAREKEVWCGDLSDKNLFYVWLKLVQKVENQ